MAWYIEETREEYENKKFVTKEHALYGPFEESELAERLNDRFADLMADDGANIEAVEMSDSYTRRKNWYINPREFWMDRLAELKD